MSARACAVVGIVVTAFLCRSARSAADDPTPRTLEARLFADGALTTNPVVIREGTVGTVWTIERVNGSDTVRVLRDTDGDGRADSSHVFLEHLDGASGIAPIGEHRALVLEPPHLFDAIDTDADGRADAIHVLAGGLDGGRGLVAGADGVLHIGGIGVRLRWDGVRIVGETSAATRHASALADGGSGRLVVAVGALIARETVRVAADRRAGTHALLWDFAPVAVIRGDAVSALAFCPDERLGSAWKSTAFCVDSDQRSVNVAHAPSAPWGRSNVTRPEIVFQASADDGPITSIDLSADGPLLVAIGANAASNGARILRLLPSAMPHSADEPRSRLGELANPAVREALVDAVRDGTVAHAVASARIGVGQRSFATTTWTPELLFVASRCGLLSDTDLEQALSSRDVELRASAVQIATNGSDESTVRRWLGRALEDEAKVVRRQALDGIASCGGMESGHAWAEILARSPDRTSQEPVLASAFAAAAAVVGLVPSDAWSRSVREAWIDAQLASRDEAAARAVVQEVLAGDARTTPSPELARLSAALRLNDRRPGRLEMDRAPDQWNADSAAHLDAAERRIVRRLLWPGRADGAMDPEPPPSVADIVDRGRRLFSNCLTCHGAAGRGQPGVYPPLAGSPYVVGDPERFARIVLHGLEGPIEINGAKFSGVMPPPTLASDDDIAAVMTYVRQAFGNSAEPVSAEIVARVRAAHATRTKPWTTAELEAGSKP